MRPAPCKTCPAEVRTGIIARYKRSCHSDLCPFDWQKWHTESTELGEQISKARGLEGDYVACKVATVKHSKTLGGKQRR